MCYGDAERGCVSWWFVDGGWGVIVIWCHDLVRVGKSLQGWVEGRGEMELFGMGGRGESCVAVRIRQ